MLSTIPCELWLDPCISHQWTIFLSSQASASWASSQRSHATIFLSLQASTCWASSQRNHAISSTLSHLAWTYAPLTNYLSIEWECTESQIETSIWYPPHNNSSVHLMTITEMWWNSGRLETTTRLRTFIPDPHPGTALPRITWVRLNHLRTGVRHLRFCLHKWGMAISVTCKCGTEDQTVDHVLVLAYCRHSHANQPYCAVFLCWINL